MTTNSLFLPLITSQSFSHSAPMASPSNLLKLVITVAVAVIFSLLLPPSTSSVVESLQKKTVLGSKPPRCVGKCLNCRPCTAELVVPEHRERNKGFEANLDRREEDDSYYLLHWKCKCGNKLYQP